MPHRENPLYGRMASDLEAMAEAIRLRPDMNHYFAERLVLLAKEMHEDYLRTRRRRDHGAQVAEMLCEVGQSGASL